MPKYISNELADLIKARGYAQAALTRTERKVSRLSLEVRQLEYKAVGEKAEVDRLDREIGRLAPRIEPRDIKETGAISRRTWRYGAFNTALARFVREAYPEITTTELVIQTARELQLRLVPAKNYEQHRERVRRQLGYWAERGFIDRLHDPQKQEEGRWRWCRPEQI